MGTRDCLAVTIKEFHQSKNIICTMFGDKNLLELYADHLTHKIMEKMQEAKRVAQEREIFSILQL